MIYKKESERISNIILRDRIYKYEAFYKMQKQLL